MQRRMRQIIEFPMIYEFGMSIVISGGSSITTTGSGSGSGRGSLSSSGIGIVNSLIRTVKAGSGCFRLALFAVNEMNT